MEVQFSLLKSLKARERFILPSYLYIIYFKKIPFLRHNLFLQLYQRNYFKTHKPTGHCGKLLFLLPKPLQKVSIFAL